MLLILFWKSQKVLHFVVLIKVQRTWKQADQNSLKTCELVMEVIGLPQVTWEE